MRKLLILMGITCLLTTPAFARCHNWRNCYGTDDTGGYTGYNSHTGPIWSSHTDKDHIQDGSNRREQNRSSDPGSHRSNDHGAHH